MVIDGSKLDASNLLQRIPEARRKSHHIRYRLVSLPQYGTLSVRGQGLSRCCTPQMSLSSSSIVTEMLSYPSSDCVYQEPA